MPNISTEVPQAGINSDRCKLQGADGMMYLGLAKARKASGYIILSSPGVKGISQPLYYRWRRPPFNVQRLIALASSYIRIHPRLS